MTNQTLPNDTLIPNDALKSELLAFKASESSIKVEDIKFTLSSDIYKELDRISQIPQLEQLHFLPPKIIVIGNESHGKSTLLERIVNLPIFPKHKELCTRCVIRVHLRRCLPTEPTIAKVSIQTPIRGEGFQRCAALDNIRESIEEAMKFLIDNDEKKRLIIDDNEIIVRISLPYTLNVDILDLPGLVTTSRDSLSSQNLPEVTQKLALKIIQENKDSSIFLLVNDIRVPPNQSRGCEVIQQCKVQAKTLGVFTKLDVFTSEDDEEEEELAQYLKCQSGRSFPVGYGWMAASSKRSLASKKEDDISASLELRSLLQMDNKEKDLFERQYPSLCSLKRFGLHNIRHTIQMLYEEFISRHWLPNLFRKLDETKELLIEKNTALGVPLANISDYSEFSHFSNSFGIISPSIANTRASLLIGHLINRFDEVYSKLTTDSQFWKQVHNYHQLFMMDQVDSNTSVKPYDYYRAPPASDVVGREVILKVIPGKKADISVVITKAHSDGTFDVEKKEVYTVNVDQEEENMKYRRAARFNVHLPEPPKTKTVVKQLYAERKVPRSRIVGLEPTVFETYLKGEDRMFSLDAAMNKMDEMKNSIKSDLTNMYDRLQMKLIADADKLKEILYKLDELEKHTTSNGTKQSFNIRRFPTFCEHIIAMLTEGLNSSEMEFRQWFDLFVQNHFDNPLSPMKVVVPEYINCKGKVMCYLHWGNRDFLEQLPHLLIARWNEITKTSLRGVVSCFHVEDSVINDESCRDERLSYFNQLKNIEDIHNDVMEFAKKVEKAKKENTVV